MLPVAEIFLHIIDLIQYNAGMEKEINIRRGIIFILISSMGFATMGMLVRLSGDIPFTQKAFFRNSIAFIVSFSILLANGIKNKSVFNLPKSAIPYLFLRCAIGCLGIFGNFYAIGYMNISDASMLNRMAPFFALFFSIFLLKEKPGIFVMTAIFTAFAGALLVIKPSFDFSKTFPSLVGFLGGAGAGFAAVCIRKLKGYGVNGFLIISVFSIFSCILSIPFIAVNFVPMTQAQLLTLIGAGVAAAFGQFGLTGAYFNAPASKISIYEYSNVIFSAILGFLFLDQIPDHLSFIGYGVIILAALTVFIYNHKKSQQNQERPAS